MAGAIGGVPASNLAGSSAGVKRSAHTRLIMLPPPRNGGMASSSSSRPYSTPMPVGPSILWPLKARKSAPSSRTSVGKCGTLWAASTSTTAPAAWARRAISATGLIVPSTFETEATATIFVRSVSKRVERVEDQQAVVGDRNVLEDGAGPLGQLLPGHEVGVVLHRGDEDFVAGSDVRIAPTAGHQVDAGGRAGREDDFAGISAPMKARDFFAGFLVLLGAALAERVDAAVDVGVIALVHAAEHLDHLPRPLRAGGVVEKHQRPVAVDRLLQDRKILAHRRQSFDDQPRRQGSIEHS